MKKRYDLQENKESELIQLLKQNNSFQEVDLPNLLNEFKQIDCICITPPEYPPFIMHYLTLNSLSNYDTGNSVKPGNLKLNIKKLINTIPGIIEASVSISYNIPILKICAALSLWKSIKDVFTVEINHKQAVILIALWKNCDSSHHINLEEGCLCVNRLYKSLAEEEINSTIYNLVIDQLIKLKCIDVTNNTIWLREWISTKY